ncbi:MAG: protein kinase domain-containing protein [Phycisphaerales bacterium]
MTPRPDDRTLINPGMTPAPRGDGLEAGTTLGGRYRVVNRLGKGGMGDVYRADDLTLGVSVAVKFLPASLAADPVKLDRFRAEVRLARQVSHANVCRVFDIGESDGRVFLTMEYVDGEDLASLLRRIGRLPQDKAVQIARQICFGLAAAHEQGIIHQDLKPANIMLDGRGNARIMDFGIAGAAADLASHQGPHAGTPGYMAPEQASGGALTRQADLYALGAVLYELFTGVRAIDSAAAGVNARRASPTTTGPTRPTTLVPDLDPAVERVILRCLEPEPAKRPPSSMAVAAALPGGDPLAAALAAGETPSPELVAASGGVELMSPTALWSRGGIVVALLALSVIATASWSLVSRVKPAKSPVVLEDRAREIVRKLGYADYPSTDSARGLTLRSAFAAKVNLDKEVTDKPTRLAARPGAYEFWYRQSPAAIVAESNEGVVSMLTPHPVRAGEVVLRTDSAGRLETFIAVPSRRRSPITPAEESGPSSVGTAATVTQQDADVATLFQLAEFDPSRFAPAPPTVRAFVATDVVKSWTGTMAGAENLSIVVHIGWTDGRVNLFSTVYPWAMPGPETKPQPPPPRTLLAYFSDAVIVLIVIGAATLAWRNLRAGRGDRTTAFRVGLAVLGLMLLTLASLQHAMPALRGVLFDGDRVSMAVFTAVEFWLFYVALEPYVRRVYPHALVGWARAARGAALDPLVGRQILVGLVIGSISVASTVFYVSVLRMSSDTGDRVFLLGRTAAYLGGPSQATAFVGSAMVNALMFGAGSMLPVIAGQIIFRRRWVGYVLLAVVLAGMSGQNLISNPTESIPSVVIAMIPMLAIRRGGLLGLVVTHITISLGLMLPVGLDWSHWLTSPVWIPATVLAAMLALAVRGAAGRPPAH